MAGLGLVNILGSIREETNQNLYASFLTTEDGQPIVEEDGNNIIRENL